MHITETEQAIRKLHSKIQEPYRILAGKKLKQIKTVECQQNTTAKREFYTVNKLKDKFVKENVMFYTVNKLKDKFVKENVMFYTVNKLKDKLVKENAMIVKADKGRTSVIIYTEDYNKKVNDFLKENNFQIIPKDPTEK